MPYFIDGYTKSKTSEGTGLQVRITVDENGGVNSVTITSPGNGYVDGDTIRIDAPSETEAILKLSMTDVRIDDISIAKTGSGYTAGTYETLNFVKGKALRIPADDSTGSTRPLDAEYGMIRKNEAGFIEVYNKNKRYDQWTNLKYNVRGSTLPRVIDEYIPKSNGEVEQYKLFGTSYGLVVGDTVQAIGGTTNAEFEIISVDSEGNVTEVNLLAEGSGYSSSSLTNFQTIPERTPVGFEVLTVGSNGEVLMVSITNGGLNYKDTIVNIPTSSSSIGSGFSFDVATVDGSGTITDITIRNAGSGYSVGDTLTTIGVSLSMDVIIKPYREEIQIDSEIGVDTWSGKLLININENQSLRLHDRNSVSEFSFACGTDTSTGDYKIEAAETINFTKNMDVYIEDVTLDATNKYPVIKVANYETFDCKFYGFPIFYNPTLLSNQTASFGVIPNQFEEYEIHRISVTYSQAIKLVIEFVHDESKSDPYDGSPAGTQHSHMMESVVLHCGMMQPVHTEYVNLTVGDLEVDLVTKIEENISFTGYDLVIYGYSNKPNTGWKLRVVS